MRRPGRRSRKTAGVFTNLSLLFPLILLAPDLSAQTTTRVSVHGPNRGNGPSQHAHISASGRFAVYSSTASNLVDGDTNWVSDVFVHDRQTGETTRASIDGAGNQGNSLSQFPRISAHGRFVAFESMASNLVPGDTNGALDVFVRDRQSGKTTRVSLAADGAQGNSASGVPCPSSGGRFVGFESLASNLVAGDSNESTDVFVHDRQTLETTRVSVDSQGRQANGSSAGSSMGSMGRYVAFESLASNLVDDDTNRVSDVFVHDHQTGGTTRISVDSRGRQANGGNSAPSLSADGRFVAFGSYASNLVDGDTNQDIDVFVHDRQTGGTTRISVDSQGREANGSSGIPAISADGRWIAFHSFASNLVEGDNNGSLDIFVHDRKTGTTTRASLTEGGRETNGPSLDPTISSGGRFVAFESEAFNLVPRDDNGTVDVFVRDRGRGDPSAALGEEKRVGLTARGKSRHGIRPSLRPAFAVRCDSVTYSRYAPSSRLVRRAQERSRCSRDFHHGLLSNRLLGWLRQGLYGVISAFRVRTRAPILGWLRVPATALAHAEPAPVRFDDVTEEAGIRFRHFKGETGKRYLPETMGSGLAVFDFDQDGWMDLFFVNGWRLEGGTPEGVGSVLYRNRGDGTFADVTREAGLGIHAYGMGAAAGDYDNDGFPDLYVTILGVNRLYRNNGDGTFSNVTVEAGVGDPSWGASAAWLDADNDGKLDLFVTNYVRWSPSQDQWCGYGPGAKHYCTPEIFAGDTSRLFRNLGEGRFRDVTPESGLFNPSGKALGVALWDFDGNGLLDLVVAEDTQPDKIYLNRGGFRFEEVGTRSGFGFSEAGQARAGMGVDVADADNNGRGAVAVTNFSFEGIGYYRFSSGLAFTDQAVPAGIGQPSLFSLGFGLLFLDYDLDGWQDLLAVNGHIDDLVETVQTRLTYRQRPLLFHNQTDGRFLPMGGEAGRALDQAYAGRGAAAIDYDNDGDLDLVLTENGGPAHLFRNQGGNRNHWIQIRLVGSASNRDAVGALVTVKTGSTTQRRYRRTGSSYLSQSDPRLTFGLGDSTRVDRLEIRWPGGAEQILENVPAGRLLVVQEPVGKKP